jgi:hypothetical protein
MRPVMTITIHIGYTGGSLYRELPLPGGPEVGVCSRVSQEQFVAPAV